MGKFESAALSLFVRMQKSVFFGNDEVTGLTAAFQPQPAVTHRSLLVTTTDDDNDGQHIFVTGIKDNQLERFFFSPSTISSKH